MASGEKVEQAPAPAQDEGDGFFEQLSKRFGNISNRMFGGEVETTSVSAQEPIPPEPAVVIKEDEEEDDEGGDTLVGKPSAPPASSSSGTFEINGKTFNKSTLEALSQALRDEQALKRLAPRTPTPQNASSNAPPSRRRSTLQAAKAVVKSPVKGVRKASSYFAEGLAELFDEVEKVIEDPSPSQRARMGAAKAAKKAAEKERRVSSKAGAMPTATTTFFEGGMKQIV